jgi:hypothetical protein
MTKNNFFKQLMLLAVCIFAGTSAHAQLKVGNNPASINPNAVFEAESTNKGMLLPRLALSSTASFAPLAAHVEGMTVYNTATAGDVTPGFYYNNGTVWVRVGTATASNNTTSGQLITITNGAGATFTAMGVAVDTTALKTFVSNTIQNGSITGKNTTSGQLVTITNGAGATLTSMTVGVDTTALKTFLTGKVGIATGGAPLTGNGTSGSPLSITQNTLSAGQLTTVTGGTNATFTAATVGIDTTALKNFITTRGLGADNWGTQTAATRSPMMGAGTATSPIAIDSAALAVKLTTSPLKDSIRSIINTNITNGTVAGKTTTAGSLISVTNGSGAALKDNTVAVDTAALKTFIAGAVSTAPISTAIHTTVANNLTSSPLKDSVTKVVNNSLAAGTITGKDYTATNAALTITGGTGTTIKATTIALNQTQIKLDSLTGSLVPSKITASGTNGQVLTTVAGVTTWQNAASGADNWGTQTAVTRSPMMGAGTAASPIAIDSAALAIKLTSSPLKDSIGSIINTNITNGTVTGQNLSAGSLLQTTGTPTGASLKAAGYQVDTTALKTFVANNVNKSPIKDSITTVINNTISSGTVTGQNLSAGTLLQTTGTPTGASLKAAGYQVDTTALKTFMTGKVSSTVSAPLTGSGTAASPLSVTQNTTTAGQLTTVTGGTNATFTAMTVGVDTTALKTFMTGKLAITTGGAPLTGSGTAASPLSITRATATSGVLTTVNNGTNAAFTAISYDVDTTALKTFLNGKIQVATSAPISGSGTTASPITMTSTALAAALKTSPAMDTVAAIAKANGDGDAWGVTGEDLASAAGRTGDVGIGNIAPSHKLHVTGNARVTTKPTALVTDSVVMRFTDGELRQMSIARLLGQFDTDGDGIADAIDPDIDGDGIVNASDTCQKSPGCLPSGCPRSCPVMDTDGDGIPDYSDPDIDGDGILNATDSCKIQYGCAPSGCPRSCSTPAPSVISDCNLNGFEGTYISGTAMVAANKFTVTITNNSFSSATISFGTGDLILSGVSGISVSAVSPSSATLGAGATQLVTYSLSGTAAACGALTATWTKLSLSCTRTKTMSPNVNCATGTWSTAVSPIPVHGLIAGVSYSGTHTISYTGGGCTLPVETLTSNGLTLTYAGGSIPASGQLTYTLSGTYTGTDSGSVTFTSSAGCKIFVGPLRSCKAILAAVPSSISGVYKIDVDSSVATYGVMSCQCDMSTDGGGWTLVANYVASYADLPLAVSGFTAGPTGGQIPASSFTNKFPLISANSLGQSEVGNSTNFGCFIGVSASTGYNAWYTPTEYRVSGSRSNGNTLATAVTANWKTPMTTTMLNNLKNYDLVVQIAATYTPLTGNTASVVPLNGTCCSFYASRQIDGNPSSSSYAWWSGYLVVDRSTHSGTPSASQDNAIFRAWVR